MDKDTNARTCAIPRVDKEPIEYMDRWTAKGHREITGRWVTVDLGRKDMLYCVHERSTLLDPLKLPYTNQEQDTMRKTKEHRRLMQRLKFQDPEAEVDGHNRFLVARAYTFAVLQRFYELLPTVQ
ncbi:hypothetical protein BX666DRAFT_2025339 [Dichotomocladium elegans]|nr:hypothetical protein BX666DRAFT_2025339 [Dichotomocladium elegans]